jgi:hypothetical protein
MLKVMVIVLAVLVVLIIGLGVLVVSQLGVDRTPVELALRLEPGREYVHRTSVEVEGGGGGMEMNQTMSMVSSVTVEDVSPEGNLRLRSRMEEVKMDMDAGPNMQMSYDSTDTTSAPPAGLEVLAKLAGMEAVVTLSPAGKVVSVETDEEEPSLAEPTPAAQGVPMLSNGSTEDAVRQMYDLAVYPPGPVSIGDTWEVEFPGLSELPVEADAQAVFKLRDRSGGRAYIDMTGDIEAEQKQSTPVGNISLTLQADLDGEIIMDEATGCILTSEATADMKVKVKAPGGMMGGGSQDMRMKMEMRQQLVEKGYAETSISNQQ